MKLALLIIAVAVARTFALAQEVPAESREPALAQARNLLTAGKLQESEKVIREFLSGHETSAEGHYLLGYVLFKENEPQTSLAEYTKGGRYRPLGAAEFEVIGCDYFLLEDYSSADKWLTKSVNAGYRSALALYLLGRTKYNERHFDEAISFFKQSLEVDPKDIKAQTYLGHAYEELGRTGDAAAAYRSAIELAGRSLDRDSDPYFSLGSVLLDNGKASEAVQYFAQAAQLSPDQPQIHRQLGKAYMALNQFAAARPELEKAAHLDPQSGPTHFLLAECYQKLGLAAEAAAEQSRYRELSGAHSVSDDPLSEARSLVQSGQFAVAEHHVRKYLELHKNSADGHYLLGYILFKKLDAKGSLAEYTEGAKYRRPTARDLEVVAGDYVILHDYADADKWFTESVNWDPTNWQALYYLGRTKYNENRFEEAVKIFSKCLEMDPRNVKAEDNLGLSYEGLGRTDDAAAAYQNAISWQNGKAQKDSGPYLDLGTLLDTNGHYSEALGYLQQALAISPQDVRVHRELGKAYMHLNQLDQAEAELQRSISLAPDSAPTHFVLAQLYRKRGLTEKAHLEMQRYTTLAASHSVDDSP